MKELHGIAEGIAEVTLELMEDSIDWQLEYFISSDGDDYNAIHSAVMQKAIEIMYLQTKNDGERHNIIER
tara:strand:+ start:1931 stop:2140 length:210 start_codon:yes stop_codon:yes gene_type:complete